MRSQEFISNSIKDTRDFAAAVSKKLKAGDVIALYGVLGAGKTTFVQGLAVGLGYSGRVFSPTFIFVRPYQVGKHKSKIKTLNHIDLYRIEKPADAKTIGIEEFLIDKGAASAIEWPEKLEGKLPENTIKIKIEILSDTKRKIKVGV